MCRILPVALVFMLSANIGRAEMLIDPHSFLNDSAGGNNFTVVAGLTLKSDTDYEVSDILSLTVSAERSTFDVGAFYALQPNIGLYGSLLYDMSADVDINVLDVKSSLDGFQLAFGGFGKINDIGGFPTIVWAELNLVRESAESSDVDFNGQITTDTADLEGTELTGGILFRVLGTDDYTVSGGAEIIVLSNGKWKDSDGSFDAERSDKFGLKGIAQYKLNQSTNISAYLNLLNETKIGITASLAFN